MGHHEREEYVVRACVITYVAAVVTAILITPNRPSTQNIEQQVIVMPEATTDQVAGEVTARIERMKNALSNTTRP